MTYTFLLSLVALISLLLSSKIISIICRDVLIGKGAYIPRGLVGIKAHPLTFAYFLFCLVIIFIMMLQSSTLVKEGTIITNDLGISDLLVTLALLVSMNLVMIRNILVDNKKWLG